MKWFCYKEKVHPFKVSLKVSLWSLGKVEKVKWIDRVILKS